MARQPSFDIIKEANNESDRSEKSELSMDQPTFSKLTPRLSSPDSDLDSLVDDDDDAYPSDIYGKNGWMIQSFATKGQHPDDMADQALYQLKSSRKIEKEDMNVDNSSEEDEFLQELQDLSNSRNIQNQLSKSKGISGSNHKRGKSDPLSGESLLAQCFYGNKNFEEQLNNDEVDLSREQRLKSVDFKNNT